MANVRTSMVHDRAITTKKLAPATSAQVLIGQGSSASPAFKALSGGATIDANGVVTIGGSATVPASAVYVTGQASTNLAQDDLCYVSSVTAAGVPIMTPADADLVGRQATWVCTATVLSGAQGTFRKAVLSAATLNTNAGNVGDPVYLSTTGTTGNTWTLTAPTTAASSQQVCGRIVVKSATVGQIAWDLLSFAPTQTLGTVGIQNQAVTGAKLDGAAVSPSVVGAQPNFISPGAIAPGSGALVYEIVLAVPDAASGNQDFTNFPFKFYITSVQYIKTGGIGNAGNSITLDNGTTGNHITAAMNNATDTGTAGTTTLDDAYTTVAAGATLRCVTVRAGGDNSALIVIRGHIVT